MCDRSRHPTAHVSVSLSSVPAVPPADAPAPTPTTAVRYEDRVIDAASALLLVGGVALFAVGRSALTSLANGTYPPPLGETWVARTDFHANQTKLGSWLIMAGVAVALVSAARHFLHRRRAAR